MEKKIITIGFDLPGQSDSFHQYSTNQSLLDADIVVFETNFSDYHLDHSSEPYFQGKPCYDKNSSFQLQEDTQHWCKELSTALEAGKTVFVFFRKFEEVFIHTGQNQSSGTGRNTRVTNAVTRYNNYQFSPIKLPTIIPKEGKEIVFKGHSVFSSFWTEFKDYLKYESYIDGEVRNPIFLTRTGEKVVGAVYRVGKGNLVLLPPLKYDEGEFSKYNSKKEQYFWTSKAVKFGNRLLQV